MENSTLRQIIRESIQNYIREIDEAGNVAALEAKIAKTEEAIEARKSKMNLEGIDEAYHEMLDKGKVKELQKEIKHLEKSKAKYENLLEKMKNKGKKKTEEEGTEEGVIDEVNIDEYTSDPESGSQLEEEIGAKDFTYKDKNGKTKYVTADNIEQAKEKVKKFGADPNTVKNPQLKEDYLNESFLYMQKLAGVITEAQYKAKIK